MAVRNMDAGAVVKDLILAECPKAEIDLLMLDLSSLESVHAFCSSFISLNLPLNVLINNAGIMGGPFTLTKDGLESQFVTNYLGHFLLTKLLLPSMIATAEKSGIEGRIINVSSDAHWFAPLGGFRFENLNLEKRYIPYINYAKSKLALILHSNELARRLKEDGAHVTVNSVNPGIIVTKILRNYHRLAVIAPLVENILSWIVLKTIPQGAATQCFLAIHPAVCGVSGKYFQNCTFSKRSDLASSATLSRKLWEFSDSLLQKNA
ncbi:hypothetical protein KP509_11G038900 [Ceratopteris richardii]|nr:hypothetical protein KP509_11G038900 [Ceratopteris richardii]